MKSTLINKNIFSFFFFIHNRQKNPVKGEKYVCLFFLNSPNAVACVYFCEIGYKTKQKQNTCWVAPHTVSCRGGPAVKANAAAVLLPAITQTNQSIWLTSPYAARYTTCYSTVKRKNKTQTSNKKKTVFAKVNTDLRPGCNFRLRDSC